MSIRHRTLRLTLRVALAAECKEYTHAQCAVYPLWQKKHPHVCVTGLPVTFVPKIWPAYILPAYTILSVSA